MGRGSTVLLREIMIRYMSICIHVAATRTVHVRICKSAYEHQVESTRLVQSRFQGNCYNIRYTYISYLTTYLYPRDLSIERYIPFQGISSVDAGTLANQTRAYLSDSVSDSVPSFRSLFGWSH